MLGIAHRPLLGSAIAAILVFCAAALSTPKLIAGVDTWSSIVTGSDLPIEVFEPQPAGASAPPVAVYLKRLAAPRVGTVADDVLVTELRASGCLVVTIDYAGHRLARVPAIHRDLAKLREDFGARALLGDRTIDYARVYILPSGCRLVRDVVYYRDTRRTLALDIIHPAKPLHLVGSVLEFSCDNRNRFGNDSLATCSDTILDGAATEGWIVAMADHPVAPPYKGLDPMPDSARKIKAAVRTLRAETRRLGGNGAIVPMGFSRGSGMALMLVTTSGMPEFEGFGENTTVASTVEGAVVMSGRFTYLDLLSDDLMIPRYVAAWGPRASALGVWRSHGALDYLTGPTVPLFLTINATESREALHQMHVLRARLDAIGSPATFFPENEPRGHKVPLDPSVLMAMHAYLKERLGAHGD